MAYKAINNLQTIDIDSLDAGSATKEYPLGTIITINDTSKAAVGEFIYVKAHAGFATVGTPFEVTAGSGGDAEVVTKAIATLASIFSAKKIKYGKITSTLDKNKNTKIIEKL